MKRVRTPRRGTSFTEAMQWVIPIKKTARRYAQAPGCRVPSGLNRMTSYACMIRSEERSSIMCGRFTLFEGDKILSKEFGGSGIPLLSPRYNIAPSQPVAAVRAAPAGSAREIALLRWGLLPSWSKDPAIGNRLINAQAETAREKPSFRTPFKRHRCLIPTNGFFRVAAAGAWETAVLRPDARRAALRLRRVVGSVGEPGGGSH
jgi:hypothetical protein